MRRNTRRYAKRQLTWMRKLPAVHLIDITDRTPDDVAAELHGMIRACASRSGKPSATTT
jgi:tRNA dimethylallyltransferase